MKNIEDFLGAAETCIQFQENARQCFPKEYKDFYLTHAKHIDGNISNKLLSINRVQNFLNIFGDLIETITWGTGREPAIGCPYTMSIGDFRLRREVKEDQEYDENHLRLIANNCGKTVKELKFINRSIDFNTMHKFLALEKLQITKFGSVYVKTSNPGLFPNLKILKITSLLVGNIEWLEQTFPKLIEFKFDSPRQPLNQNTLIEFIKRNPQLESLYMETIDMSSSFWHAFDDLSSTELRSMHIDNRYNGLNIDKIEHLSKCFTNLKYIHIPMKMDVAKQFVKLLAENNVPIEILSMDQCDIDCAEIIQKLKHIKALRIRSVFNIQRDLKKLCKTLPTLKWLKIEMIGLNEMEIIDALIYGKNLNMLSIIIHRKFSIDSNFIYKLRNINNNRVKLEISGYGLIACDNSISNHNNGNWLKIRKGSSSPIEIDGISELYW